MDWLYNEINPTGENPVIFAYFCKSISMLVVFISMNSGFAHLFWWFLLFLFFSLHPVKSFSQAQFCIAIGGSGAEIAYEILQLSDGGYCIAGWTTSFGQGGRDVYIVKLNSIGIIEWTRTVGGSSDDDLTSALQTMDGGFIASGGTTTYGQGDKDIYVVKLALDGTVLWTKSFGDFGYEVSGTIIENYNGFYTLGGWTTSLGLGASEGYLLRIDNSGNLLWTRSLGGSGADLIYSIIQTPDYGFIAAGATGSFGAGSNDVYLAKFDTTGSLQWTKTIGGSAAEWSFSIVQTTDFGYIIGATTASYGAGSDDFYVLKIDSQGSLLWTRTIGGTGTEWSRSIIQTSDGGFAITGFTSSFGAGGQDVYLVKLTANGNFEWSRTFGGVGDDVGMSLIETSDGGLAITGSTTSFGSGGMDVYIIKLAPGNVNCCITSNDMGTTFSGGVAGSGGQISSGGFVSSGGISGSGGILTNQCCLFSVTSTISQSDPSCYGMNNGVALSSPTGGTPPYTFSWSNGQTDSVATGLSAGVYYLTITDNSSCIAMDTAYITAPPPMIVSLNKQDLSCDAGDLSIWSSASGGTAPFMYLWSTGSTTTSVTGLSSGTFTITVTDSKGCTATDTIGIYETGSPALSIINLQYPSCYGLSDASASITASGGAPPYTFDWSNGQSGSTVTGLDAGIYYVTVTDNNSCSDTDTITVYTPALLTASIFKQDADCDTADGVAVVTVTGGTSPLTVLWSNGSTSGSIVNLGAGVYSVTVTDTNGCVDSVTTVINETQSAGLYIDSLQNVTCSSINDGSVTVSASGTPPPYTFQWSTGQSVSGITQATMDSLQAGVYNLSVSDSNGCTAVLLITITQPSVLNVTTSSTGQTCLVYGTATATATGGTQPYSYLWSNGDTSSGIQNQASSIYSITVTDANKCIETSSVVIAMMDSVIVSINGTPEICGEQTVQLLASASPPADYLWNTGDTTSFIVDSPAVTTFYSVIAAVGICSDTADYLVTVFPAVNVILGNDTSIIIGQTISLQSSLSGGTPSYSYLWLPESGNSPSVEVTPSVSTYYSVTVTDANGCIDYDTVFIDVLLCDAEVFVPNVFAPACRCPDKYFRVFSDCIIEFEFLVFDRWGEKVFELQGADLQAVKSGDWWDGAYRDNPMDAAVFVWFLKYTTVNDPDEEKLLEGNVNLVR
ncbi:MAG: gliding motility-associated C-terminal domain-containing protein [Bacteroidetes bacterium]|nr:gliding motility-associated C-terminal domain-containing protein [Bacteroidota bacterium]